MKKIYLYLLLMIISFFSVFSTYYTFALVQEPVEIPWPTCKLSYTPSGVVVGGKITGTLTSTNVIITKMGCAPKGQAIVLSTKCGSSNCGSNGSWSINTSIAQETTCKVEVTNSVGKTATCSASYIVEGPEPVIQPVPKPVVLPKPVVPVIQKTISLTSPAEVIIGKQFTYSWNAIGGYEYCTPYNSFGSNTGKLNITGSLTMTAPKDTSSTTLTVGVQCYYRDSSGAYKNDYKKQVITLKNDVVSCTTEYAPVCGVKNLEACQIGANYVCNTVPIYKTFSNKCNLSINTEGFTYYKEGVCVTPPVIQKTISLSAPTEVIIGKQFTYSWNAVGGYEYCEYGPLNNIGSTLPPPGPQRLGLTGSVNLTAQTIYTTTPMTVGVTCYSKGNDGTYKGDSKTKTITLKNDVVSCTTEYAPVCGVKSLDACQIGASYSCNTVPIYKTFSNKCNLSINTEGFTYYKEGVCVTPPVIQKSITLTAPAEVIKGKQFTYSWIAQGGYEYCTAERSSLINNGDPVYDDRGISGSINMTIPTSSTSTSLTVGVSCYYRDSSGVYRNDSKTKTITLKNDVTVCTTEYVPVCGVKNLNSTCPPGAECLIAAPIYKTFTNKCNLSINTEGYTFYKEGVCPTVNSCVGLGGSGPNASLGPNDLNKDKVCCEGLTLVTPPNCNKVDPITGLNIRMEGCGTICAKVGDGVCDARYENSNTSYDCRIITPPPVIQKSITLTAPTEVKRGTQFTYSWIAKGGYEYCTPYNSFGSNTGKLNITGSLNMTAPKDTTSTTLTVGVSCYYRDSSGAYKNDYKKQVIQLKDDVTVCTTEYIPVCGVKYIEACNIGESNYSCKTFPTYKTFSNKCNLSINREGFTYYKEGVCETITPKSISLTAPAEVVKGKQFTYSWVAKGYEYCIRYEGGDPIGDSVGLTGSINMIAPSLSKLDSFTVGVKCYGKGDIMDYKKQVIQLKNDVTVCTTEYVPVCGVKYLQSCQSGANSSCSTVPIYKTFTNSCELKNNKAKFVFNRNGSCESIAGSSTKLADNNSTKLADNSSIKLTDAIELQLDQSINNLLVKINQNYTNKVDKVNYINTIISKLQTIEKNQPKYTNVTQYLINKLNDEISKIGVDGSSDGIDEILNIFN